MNEHSVSAQNGLGEPVFIAKPDDSVITRIFGPGHVTVIGFFGEEALICAQEGDKRIIDYRLPLGQSTTVGKLEITYK